MLSLIENGKPEEWAGVHTHLTLKEISASDLIQALCARSEHFRPGEGGVCLFPYSREAVERFGMRVLPLEEYVTALGDELAATGLPRWYVYYRAPGEDVYRRRGTFFHEGRALKALGEIPDRHPDDHAQLFKTYWPLAQVLDYADLDREVQRIREWSASSRTGDFQFVSAPLATKEVQPREPRFTGNPWDDNSRPYGPDGKKKAWLN